MPSLSCLLAFLWVSSPDLARRIDSVARGSTERGSLRIERDSVYLHGVWTNGPDTREGRWACAKVVSIVLRRTGAMKNIVLGVRDIETALKGWRKIQEEDSLQPGDVIVWTRRYQAPPDGSCIGGGTCHVGIQTSQGRFHNDPMLRHPSFDGLSLLAFRFKAGYRAP